jgi:predicted GIY-YIG superfamily endonuclease
MYIYVIQPLPPKKYLCVNFENSAEHGKALNKFKIRNSKPLAVLRDDLSQKKQYNTAQVRSYCKKLATELNGSGYVVVAGAAVYNNFRQTYVIYLNSNNSKAVYVGQTIYPRELRIKQHQLGIRPARVFKNNKNIPHSLAYELMDNKKYFKLEAALEAEANLAHELKKGGYEVFGGTKN